MSDCITPRLPLLQDSLVCDITTMLSMLSMVMRFPGYQVAMVTTQMGLQVTSQPGQGAHLWCSWLRHCAASQKVAGSIPNVVTGISHSHNPSGCTTAPGLTQPLTEMNTRNISWGVNAAGA